jgi:hypothetical protein
VAGSDELRRSYYRTLSFFPFCQCWTTECDLVRELALTRRCRLAAFGCSTRTSPIAASCCLESLKIRYWSPGMFPEPPYLVSTPYGIAAHKISPSRDRTNTLPLRESARKQTSYTAQCDSQTTKLRLCLVRISRTFQGSPRQTSSNCLANFLPELCMIPKVCVKVRKRFPANSSKASFGGAMPRMGL